MDPAVRWAELPSGLALPYTEHGDGGGVPLVLLHGYVESWRSFEPLIAALPRSGTYLAPSLRGHGGPRTLASTYSLGAMAADVADLMDVVGVGRAVVVGASSGGYIAQQLAVERPESVRALVLVGSPRSLRDIPQLEAFAGSLAEQPDPVEHSFIRELIAGTVSQSVPASFLETMIGEGRAVPTGVWQAVLEALREATPPTEANRITAPTLILWGDRDAYVSKADTEQLAASILSSRVIIYEGAGHALLWEEPVRIAADIVRFVDGLGL